MAAIPVTISGTILTKAPKSGQPDQSGKEQCVIQGLLSIQGLEVGGGPIIPPEGGQQPPEGGQHPPVPTFPIYFPPGVEIPDKPGYPAHPAHPGPILPPDAKPDPKWEAKVGWTEDTGWFVVLVPGEGTNVPTPSRQGQQKK